MKKQVIKMLALVLALVCLLGTTVLAESAVLTAAKPSDSPFVWNLQEQYCRLDNVENLVTAQIGDQNLGVEIFMTYPSGKTVNAQSFQLNEAGLYTVKATAAHDDKVYTEEKQFLVYTAMFEVEGGSAVYRNHPYTEITGEANAVSSVKGLLVTIPEGGKLTVTAPLDISGRSFSNALLKFYVVSTEKGVKDINRLRFTFTDMADPNNKLVFTCTNVSNGASIRNDMNLWLAGATGQNLVGYQNDQGQDKVWVNTGWGAPGIGAWHMSPWKDDSSLTIDCFGIWMDEAMKVYAGRGQNYICDLDDPKFHTNLWSGFSSDMVILTIEAEQYTGNNPAQIFITEMMSVDLQAQSVYDTSAPTITLDCAPYAENALPNACVGKPYPVFAATAYDPEMNPTNVELAVYGGMYSDTRYLVDGKTGTFTPDLPGTYTIKYTATDSWGNTTEKLAYVYASEPEGVLSLNLPDKVVSGKVGQKVLLSQEEITGNFGNAKVDIQVKFGEELIPYTDGFIPYKDGTYQVNYTVTDYIGQQITQSYEVQVAKTDMAVFGEIPAVNRYMMLGMPNYVPIIDAYNYVTADGARIEAVTYAEDAAGVHKVEGRNFTPAEGSTEVTIWWESTIEGKTAVTEKATVPVISVKSGEDYLLNQFFVCKDVETSATENNVVLKPVAEGATAAWATPLLAEGFSVIFSADKIGSCTVLLEDYEDPTQKLEIVIKTSTGVAVVNGTRNYPLTKSGANYILQFDPISNTLSDGKTKLVPLDAQGNTFSGFGSGKLYLSMKYEKLEPNAAVKVLSINAHNLNNRTFDMLKPGVSVLGETGGMFIVGDQATVYKGATADAISPFCTFYVNVLDPDGEIVTNTDGEKMEQIYPDRDYTIELTKVGAYIVQFYSEDADGNKEKNISYALNVLDLVAPVLSAPASSIPENAKVGEKLKIPTVTATDAVDGESEVLTYVVRPDLRIQTVTTGSVEFTMTGMYVIKYYAFDTAGNSNILEYTVFVS